MTEMKNIDFEKADPNPEYLIKSIAEQGYSLESALADLMDNSISANANKIEVLIKMEQEPFTLFIADNGNGMDEETLKASMQFPSNSSARAMLPLNALARRPHSRQAPPPYARAAAPPRAAQAT
jgi:hypothetical protein